MRRTLKATGLMLVGFIVGAIATGSVFALRSARSFKHEYYAGILRNAHDAYMIRAERESELLEAIDASLRQCIATASALYGKDPQRLEAFWLAQRYYKTFSLPVPPEISPILESMPPRPLTSCELKELGQTRNKATAEPSAAPLPRDPQPDHSEGER
jgi:hypothetical protein